MRALLVAALLFVGCKDKATPAQETSGSAVAPAPASPGSAGARSEANAERRSIDWTKCEAAITSAVASPLAARPRILIDGCHVCGDWTPILRWATPTAQGGPKQPEIAAALDACKAFCTGSSKMMFLRLLDGSRGTGTRLPWRELGGHCKESVSAVPDARFLDGAYFALDRIARAVAAHGGASAKALTELELPLPAVGEFHTGPVLPRLDKGISPATTDFQITIIGSSIMVGKLPRARLTGDGIQVDLGPDAYPGKSVTLARLKQELEKLAAGDKTKTVSIVMPREMQTYALRDVVVAAAEVMDVYLAALAHESPEGWNLPGAITVKLVGADPKTTVFAGLDVTTEALAETLAQHAARGVTRVGIAVR